MECNSQVETNQIILRLPLLHEKVERNYKESETHEMLIWYSVNAVDDERYSVEVDSICRGFVTEQGLQMDPNLQMDLAEECADNYYHKHSGYEDSWPITLFLFTKEDDKLPVGKFRVDVDWNPVFFVNSEA